MVPEDVDPESGCRLPLPKREELDADAQRVYDSLADPGSGSLRGLRGPGGILLHSPELARYTRPLNHHLRHEAGLGGRVRELAILTTARALDSQVRMVRARGGGAAPGHLAPDRRHHQVPQGPRGSRRGRRDRYRARP